MFLNDLSAHLVMSSVLFQACLTLSMHSKSFWVLMPITLEWHLSLFSSENWLIGTYDYDGVILCCHYDGVILCCDYDGVVVGYDYDGVVVVYDYAGVILCCDYDGVILGYDFDGVIL